MITEFYDALSPFYHLLFPNWKASIERQSNILDGIIKSEWGDKASTVVDVCCGIGTQAIGLAQLGYEVEASDLSSRAVERVKQEASQRGLDIRFSVADMRDAFVHHAKEFDVLISCDNSVPHLLSDTEILSAFREFYRCVKPGGGCLITVRDYEKEIRDGIQVNPHGVRIDQGVKYIIFQTWEFRGEIYDLSMYFIRDDGKKQAETQVFRSQYYAVSISTLIELLQKAEFQDVRHIESGFYQPVIVGSKVV
jgi:SAM-dependent methyltransferase